MLTYSFSQTLLDQYLNYTNTLPYLLRYWVYVSELFVRLGPAMYPELASLPMKVVELYIQVHLNSCSMLVNDRDADPLNATEGWSNELDSIGRIIRVNLDEGVKLVNQLWDNVNKDYSVRMRS